MSDKPGSDLAGRDDLPQLRRLQDWWLELPLSYRVNALLYLLGACALIFLLVSVFAGGSKQRQIQVGAGIASTTSTPAGKAKAPASGSASTAKGTNAPGATTTTRPGATTTSVAGGATGGTGGTGVVGAVTPGGGTSGAADTGSGSGTGDVPGGGGGPPAGSGTVDTSNTTAPAGGGTSNTTAPTTTTAAPPAPPDCRNSTDARCGTFRWDPPPTNQAPVIDPITADATLPAYGQNITFTVKVTEPDHSLDGACATMDFGDGTSQGTCPSPPCGPTRYGPWTTPAPPPPGTHAFTFQHSYARQADPRAFVVTFKMESRSDCYDPYGTPYNDASGTKTATIVVTVPS